MNNRKKNISVIAGLVLIILFSGLPISVEAETLYSYIGPDTSEDDLQLSDFIITGNASLYIGDTVSVTFSLTYVGRGPVGQPSYVTFDSVDGLFLKVEGPDCETRYFGNTYSGKSLNYGESIIFKTTLILDKAGVWTLWPSYGIITGEGTKHGPENGHAFELIVELDAELEAQLVAEIEAEIEAELPALEARARASELKLERR